MDHHYGLVFAPRIICTLSTQTIAAALPRYGYFFLFAAAVVEGPIITVLGAFLAAQSIFNVYIVYIVVVLGDLIGDLLYYGAGRLGRFGLIERLAKRMGLATTSFKQLELYFENHGATALFYAKYTQTGIIALPAAGAARMPIAMFLLYNILATLPKSLGLVLVGYFLGREYQAIDRYSARLSFAFFLSVCVLGAYLVFRQHRPRKS
jgi:membrane protein DedA with SNARE-associated domain